MKMSLKIVGKKGSWVRQSIRKHDGSRDIPCIIYRLRYTGGSLLKQNYVLCKHIYGNFGKLRKVNGIEILKQGSLELFAAWIPLSYIIFMLFRKSVKELKVILVFILPGNPFWRFQFHWLWAKFSQIFCLSRYYTNNTSFENPINLFLKYFQALEGKAEDHRVDKLIQE